VTASSQLEIIVMECDPPIRSAVRAAIERDVPSTRAAFVDSRHDVPGILSSAARISAIFIYPALDRAEPEEICRWLREHPNCALVPVVVFSPPGRPVEPIYLSGASSVIVRAVDVAELAQQTWAAVDYWTSTNINPHAIGARDDC
jgi:hypothetical protein